MTLEYDIERVIVAFERIGNLLKELNQHVELDELKTDMIAGLIGEVETIQWSIRKYLKEENPETQNERNIEK